MLWNIRSNLKFYFFQVRPVSFVCRVCGQAVHVLEGRLDGVAQDGGQVLDAGASFLRIPVEQPLDEYYH